MNEITTAMVLCAGLGTRMRHLTKDKPKPMVDVGGKSLIERTLENLAIDGIKKIVINLHYLADMLEEHIRNLEVSKKFQIDFIYEEDRLETAGGVKNALHLLGNDPFFVINSDAFWINKLIPGLTQMAIAWDKKKMHGLMMVLPKENAAGYTGLGDFDLTENNEIIWFHMKPAEYIFAGVQLIKPQTLKNLGKGMQSFRDVWKPRLNESGIISGYFGHVFDGNWYHVGDPEAKVLAESDIIVF